MQGAINLAEYPIEDLTSPEAQRLVARLRGEVHKNGVAALPSFLLPSAIEQIVSDVERIKDIAWRSDNEHNIYLDDLEGRTDEEVEIRKLQQKSSKRCLTYDQIPRTSPISVCVATQCSLMSDTLTNVGRVQLASPDRLSGPCAGARAALSDCWLVSFLR